jgi:hypothetical protein
MDRMEEARKAEEESFLKSDKQAAVMSRAWPLLILRIATRDPVLFKFK